LSRFEIKINYIFILKENYGSSDPWKEEKVKEIFKLLQLSRVYYNYESKAYESMMERIRKNTPAIVLHSSSRFQKSENLHTDSAFYGKSEFATFRLVASGV